MFHFIVNCTELNPNQTSWREMGDGNCIVGIFLASEESYFTQRQPESIQGVSKLYLKSNKIHLTDISVHTQTHRCCQMQCLLVKIQLVIITM